MKPDPLVGTVIQNTETINILLSRVNTLEIAVRQLATIAIRASLVLGRSAKTPEDNQESTKIEASANAVFVSLVPAELRANQSDQGRPS